MTADSTHACRAHRLPVRCCRTLTALGTSRNVSPGSVTHPFNYQTLLTCGRGQYKTHHRASLGSQDKMAQRVLHGEGERIPRHEHQNQAQWNRAEQSGTERQQRKNMLKRSRAAEVKPEKEALGMDTYIQEFQIGTRTRRPLSPPPPGQARLFTNISGHHQYRTSETRLSDTIVRKASLSRGGDEA